MKNKHNIRWYRWLSSVYDRGVKNQWLERPREREFKLAQIQPNHRVLVVGIGTGLDIPYLPKEADVVGIDLSPEMLDRAEEKTNGHKISLLEMDAEHLDFEDQSFDVIIMNLILSIVENPSLVL